MTTFIDELSAALFDAITLKYNENHDELGRFSSGGGGGSGGDKSSWGKGRARDASGSYYMGSIGPTGLPFNEVVNRLHKAIYGVPAPKKSGANKPTKTKTPKAPKGAFDYKPGEYNPFLNGGRGGIVSKKP